MIEYMIKRKSDGKTKFFEGILERRLTSNEKA